MNYKVIISWLVGGLLAYVSGRNGNVGIQLFAAILAGVLLIYGITRLSPFEDKKEKKNIFWDDEDPEPFVPAVQPRLEVKPLPVEQKPRKVAKKVSKKRRVWRLLPGHRVEILNVEPGTSRKFIGKRGVITESRKGSIYRHKVLGVWCMARKTLNRGGRKPGHKFPNGYKKNK